MKKIFIIGAIALIYVNSSAQTCEYTPADCPDEGSIQASQSPTVRLGNGLLQQEVAMQDRMRNIIVDMMMNAAKALHWLAIEMDEVANLNGLQSGGTPYALRSPRYFGIEFEFITDQDSLKAWKNWLIDFSNRYKDAGLNYMNNQTGMADSPIYKQYTDSVNKYTILYTDYITTHQNEGPKLFEDKHLKYLQDKQNQYIDKRNASVQVSSSKNNLSSFDDEKKQRVKQFRSASTIEIFFQFNDAVGTIYSSDGDEQVTNYNLPGTVISKSVHISEPDPNSIPWHFDQWENMTVLLLGKWLTKTDQYKNYNAAFTLNNQDDEHTPKKIMSDKVQTIAVHIMGSKNNIGKLISQLDIMKLNEAIFKN